MLDFNGYLFVYYIGYLNRLYRSQRNLNLNLRGSQGAWFFLPFFHAPKL